jgi:dTMP kinase
MTGPGTSLTRGVFITIDGPDGGGKTTQAERLRAHLEATGRRVASTREPGGTPFGERVRDLLLARTLEVAVGERADPLADAMLFNAARRQLVRDVIRPALASGETVVCARFADSTLAYQGYGSGASLGALATLATIATEGLEPDLTIILDLPAEIGLARKSPAESTRFETEFDLAFHRRVRDGFLALASADPGRSVVIDATRSADDVARAIADVVDARLGSGEPESTLLRTNS